MVPFALPPSILATIALLTGPVAPPQQVQEIGDLQISYTEPAVLNVEAGTFTFTGEVVARYDLTVIKSQRLVIDYRNGTGVAEGGVELTDPEAYLTTDRLEFDWNAKTGRAENVYVQVGNVRLKAEVLTIGPNVWVMERATGTLSRRKSPKYEIAAERVRIYPGRYALAEHVGMRLFGAKLGWLPQVRFDLDPRIEGFNLPAFAEKKGVGFGVSWNSSFLLNDSVALRAAWNTFPHRVPVYGLELMYMTSDPDKTFKRVRPHSDLGEQFGDGWFDNVRVRSPLSEFGSIGSPRTTYTIATAWGRSTFARPVITNDVAKMVEAVVETAGNVAGFGLRANLRLHRIRGAAKTPFVDRSVTQLAAITPAWKVANGLRFHLRGDALGTNGENTRFGWLRAQGALIWRPAESFTMGVAYSTSRMYGTPDFGFDRLFYNSALHARADYSAGPYTLRYLVRYDPATRAVFDTEYELALVAEGFEPFIIFRQSPSDFRLGVRFRIDDFVGRLQRRNVKRDIGRPF